MLQLYRVDHGVPITMLNGLLNVCGQEIARAVLPVTHCSPRNFVRDHHQDFLYYRS